MRRAICTRQPRKWSPTAGRLAWITSASNDTGTTGTAIGTKLQAALRGGTYQPQAIRRVYIPKPGSNEQRPLGIPTVRDRVVQGAVRHVIEPIFEKEFAEHSYGFRPTRGCKDALRRVDELLKQGFVYVVDADLKSYFDTIPHDRLMGRLRERIVDERLLGLIESFLKAGIMDGPEEREPEAGAPQGAVLSPLLSNIYLNPLDHQMAAQGFEMVRYADDFVILCRSQTDAEAALQQVRQWCDAEGLTLHPTKTHIVDVRTEGFDFLGYHFATTRRGRLTRWPRKKSHGQVEGHDPGENEANGRAKSGVHHHWTSIGRSGAGTAIFSTVVTRRSGTWTAGSAAVCGVCCANGRVGAAAVAGGIISAGRMLTLRSRGTSVWKWPVPPRANPRVGKTINWRAGCGKSARPVRREGEGSGFLPTPIKNHDSATSTSLLDFSERPLNH